jgi:hypothetical protein
MSYIIKTTLEKATHELNEADHHRTDIGMYYLARAQALATIAQAEQLKELNVTLLLIKQTLSSRGNA